MPLFFAKKITMVFAKKSISPHKLRIQHGNPFPSFCVWYAFD
ncbi:hypothetical protein B4168_0885 [Anoxybacillus flavithermus]|nr:hypothetical protein B4168_0885 [Anoxybacillus flavithermus]OAO86892.1 hypothetical protein GT23_1910 [Parageobacillus thermoglucosidasius]